MSEVPVVVDSANTMEIPEKLPGFEGPEKNLEIDFAPDKGSVRGLRDITRSQWDSILTAARCTILNSMGNASCDSYLLSESSLFVYSHKLVMKTCGTTTLLMALEPLIEITKALGMTVEWLAYTRKDFIFPLVQKFPHRDPQEETTFLKNMFPAGHAYVMGPLTGDHWFVFVADWVDRPTELCVDRTLDMMMFGIDEDVARLFVKDARRFPSDADVTRAAGIHTLLPGSQIQEFAFEPCGYSMNGLLYDAYWTIHITPEKHCSYASFETNIRMTNFSPLIKAVLAIFRPKRFTMTLFADMNGVAALRETPFQQVISVPVVESTFSALTGPCIMTRDATGASVIHYPKSPLDSPTSAPSLRDDAFSLLASATGAGATADTMAVAAPATGDNGTARPTASSISSAVSDAPLSATTTTTAVDAASAPSAAAPASALRTKSGDGGSGSSSDGPTPPTILFRRNGSVAKALGATHATIGPSSAMSYVMTAKSHTEFLGEYCSILGNFQCVLTEHGSGVAQMGAVQSAASEMLANPRVKHVVARSMRASGSNMMGKVRTESM